ncbi:Guanosine-diphosphatase [Scheffersomyces spartinae]|uniref:guanosine-diphosphatase n=1 Tax=Scheffersomyces spartinae TaxID=45513 RepID=A0A9P7V7P5_9ASCO|nr:Guanosine-diphosphatase [Scheffersomyces spartinae]KAG7192893.1 Guanosine-diphosphatase [Scheffersomyces spartinae]
MVILNTRNIRVVVSAIILFVLVVFLFSSKNSVGEGLLNRLKVPTDSGINAPVIPATNKPPTFDSGVGESAPAADAGEKKPPVEAGKQPQADTKLQSEKKPEVEKKPQAEKISDSSSIEKIQGGGKGSAAASSGKCDKKEYVVMIDAGSTGSRVHVYTFNTCMSPPQLLHEEFKMLKPGLSSFDTDTVGAAKSLDPLLQVALDTVPKDKQGCTPVAVKATAGLRLLGQEKSDAILKEVRHHLEVDYPFAVVEGNGISIMDGADEGVYAWITTNYLLGNIGGNDKLPTAAVFDLGGGSTQIVFEPDFPNDAEMVDGEFKYKFSFGNRDFTLYQYSHLGYGLMQGRNKINSEIIKSHIKNSEGSSLVKLTSKKEAKDAKSSITIKNPCIPPGSKAENVLVELGKDEMYVVTFQGPSLDESGSSGSACRRLAEGILNKDATCETKPCSFNGVHQPSLTRTFHKTSDMYVFSYFYDRTNPLGFPSSFTMEELLELSRLVCRGEKLWKDVLLDDHIKELVEEPQWCTDLSFISAMLHVGYDIPLGRELRTAKTIDNNELGWCLGASLPLLDKKTWKCRVKKVE